MEMQIVFQHFARERPMALVLPCLASEVNGPGLRALTFLGRRGATEELCKPAAHGP